MDRVALAPWCSWCLVGWLGNSRWDRRGGWRCRCARGPVIRPRGSETIPTRHTVPSGAQESASRGRPRVATAPGPSTAAKKPTITAAPKKPVRSGSPRGRTGMAVARTQHRRRWTRGATGGCPPDNVCGGRPRGPRRGAPGGLFRPELGMRGAPPGPRKKDPGRYIEKHIKTCLYLQPSLVHGMGSSGGGLRCNPC